ncbi:uncharacterized protein LOC127256092 [Andrographis paniculata]|uniref:uncharacterized protein LOC127256092 n=1 Tax=Andrographis paniculata TaxID=175694 RepID=UPI0021E7BA85|nr:uncharacterized protein LOC127256092 [Andrographis paniculata]
MYASNEECIFDGKIGIFPFTKKVPAQRSSKNRAARTMVTKPLESITKEVTKELLINKDNAKPHINNSDLDFRRAASADGWNMNLVFQPPNSPDTNVNDLGWFWALQSLQITQSGTTVDDILGAVHKSFEQLSHTALNSVFLSLQACLGEIMANFGSNNYKIPHLGKESLRRSGNLPEDIEVDHEMIKACIDHLMELNEVEGLKDFITSLEEF